MEYILFFLLIFVLTILLVFVALLMFAMCSDLMIDVIDNFERIKGRIERNKKKNERKRL